VCGLARGAGKPGGLTLIRKPGENYVVYVDPKEENSVEGAREHNA
jgi:hypothetical protein